VLRADVSSSDVSTDISQVVIVDDEASSAVIPAEKEMVLKGAIMVIVLKRPCGGTAVVYVMSNARHMPLRPRHALLKNMLLFFFEYCTNVINSKKTSKFLHQTHVSLTSY
jgi:hypothetical protein